jgi:virulence-associated protein VagC
MKKRLNIVIEPTVKSWKLWRATEQRNRRQGDLSKLEGDNPYAILKLYRLKRPQIKPN